MCSENEIHFRTVGETAPLNPLPSINELTLVCLPEETLEGGLPARAACSIPGMKKTAPNRDVSKSVDDYIAGIPDLSRNSFEKLRSTIKSAVPKDAAEVISYGVPAFKTSKVLVCFAAFAQHCSLFPTPAVIEDFKDELKNFTISKGTVQFPNDKPLPIPLIKKMVKARAAAVKGASTK